MYQNIIKILLFLLPPETAHQWGMATIKVIGLLHRKGYLKRGLWADHERLRRQTPFGPVPSPLGLAAGFDKNAEALWGWQALGFGFVEIGTVTPEAQLGNSTPRLFRYSRYRAIVNRMGFNNQGVKSAARRIRLAKSQGLRIKIGGNIGKNKNTEVENTARDYAQCADHLKDCVDYLVINVSSPNTAGLRDLQNQQALDDIVKVVRSEAPTIPLYIKVAPDNFENFVDGVLAVIKKYQVQGIICGNTLANHASAEGLDENQIARLPQGGLSGAPLFQANVKLCEGYTSRHSELSIIGVGGIFSHHEAIRYFQAGAKLIQAYTGLVYEGPSFVKNVLENLIQTSLQRHTTREG